MRGGALALVLVLAASAAAAQQGWGNLDRLLLPHLTQSGHAEAAFWLPDLPDPQTATRALGFAYEAIPGAAGNTGIAIGLFVKGPQGWRFAGPINGIFGQSPRDASFGGATAEVTTTMPGPNDPRCCPTVPTRWRIDFSSMVATRLN